MFLKELRPFFKGSSLFPGEIGISLGNNHVLQGERTLFLRELWLFPKVVFFIRELFLFHWELAWDYHLIFFCLAKLLPKGN